MKNIIFRYLMTGALCLAVAACYDVDDNGDTHALAPLSVGAVSDTINTLVNETLHYEGLSVENVRGEECTYTWVYGPRSTSATSSDAFQSMTEISSSQTIDYTFSKVGSFLLRLRVDNGESIAYKYFTLNVNAGFDEGLAILSNDDEGEGHLSFIQTLTSEEAAVGKEDFIYSIFTPSSGSMKKVTTMALLDYASSSSTSSLFMIATNDDNGSIYNIDPSTMELLSVSSMKSFGTCLETFAGDNAMSGGLISAYFLSPERRVFKYDMNMLYATEMDNMETLSEIKGIAYTFNRSSATGRNNMTPRLFSRDSVLSRYSASQGLRYLSEEGYEIVNACAARQRTSSTAMYYLLRSKTDPSSYKIMSGNYNGRTWNQVREFTSAEGVKMDSKSMFVNTLATNDVYYTYDNAIYHWGLSTPPGTSPAITLPQGETIVALATNIGGRGARTAGENLLYVLTYNPSRQGRKGSVYVYQFSDDTLVKAYEGVVDKPVAMLYKYRIS